MNRQHVVTTMVALTALAVCGWGCSDDGGGDGGGAADVGADTIAEGDAGVDSAAPDAGDGVEVVYTEEREPCADRNRLRNPYFGDLHVHTAYSFDAYVNQTRPEPPEAYAFARGEPVSLPPLDAEGRGTVSLVLEQPLDFAAVTDHGEFLAEVTACSTPGAMGYESTQCELYRAGGISGIALMGLRLTQEEPSRLEELCGSDGSGCDVGTRDIWSRIVDAAEQAYDRTSACQLTTFVGYEWTGNTDGRNLHRNVIFRNATVPERPVSYFEESTPEGLWGALREVCLESGEGCDVMSIPHNSNISNGGMFTPQYAPESDEAEQREQAELRRELEPLVEIFQHKGSSECNNGLSGIFGDPDELCEVEQIRPLGEPPRMLADCGDGIGRLGIQGAGCVSRTDFVRGALLTGLAEEERLGVNPMELGIIASTDTHNAAPGSVSEDNYLGHTGTQEYGLEERLNRQDLPFGLVTNPGGLAGVWAEENSRDAIFNALERREAWGTSGPRIVVRLFGGWSFPEGLCGGDLVEVGYRDGVPMGGRLSGAERAGEGGPTFLLSAMRDPGAQGSDLARTEIIKGWVDGDGNLRTRVYTVSEVDGSRDAAVNPATCVTDGEGAATLCGAWSDPDFDPSLRAFYYARVVELPSCRWSQRICNQLPAGERPEGCDDPNIPATIHEMAWSSPIWYAP